MTDTERQALLDEALASPASTTVDGTSITNRPLSELTDALDREQVKQAVKRPGRGIFFTKLKPGGAVQ